MKILIMSDIHGDFESMYKVIKQESFDKLIILGDLFSYGYKFYNLNESPIVQTLQRYKEKLILIKGNCDYYIDYDALGLYAHDIFNIKFNNHVLTLTHGDKYNRGYLPDFHGDVFISGHTHIPLINKTGDILYLNPGSIGRPRSNSTKSYLILDDNRVMLKDVNSNIIIEEYKLSY